MSVTLWLALVLQFASVTLLRIFLGKTWLCRPGTLLVLASVVYDGLSQVLLAFPSVAQWDTFRNGIAPGFINEADLVMSAAMLAFTVAYLLTCGPRREAPALLGDIELAARVLDWRVLALACLPLALLTYSGRGYNNGNLSIGAGAGTATSLASQFFVLLAVLTALALLLRYGSRWFVPVLGAQSLLLAAAGERTPVIAGAIALSVLVSCCGQKPRRSHVHTAVALTVLAVLAITGLRAHQGRAVFYTDSGLGTRVSALAAGVTAPGMPDTPGLAAQAAERLDGVSFAAGILQARSAGQPLMDPAAIPESLLIAMPSAVWPSKLQSGALNPHLAEMDDFGLQQVNFLPGLAGVYAGFLAWPWLIAFLTVLGAVWGLGEQWLLLYRTPARLVLLAGALSAGPDFPEGLPGILVDLRTAAILTLITWGAARVMWRSRAPRLVEHEAQRGGELIISRPIEARADRHGRHARAEAWRQRS
jgi:hypothetical protein